MSTDYGEKERQFLATLKADTGRDVAEWMTALAAQNLTGRNQIIDWLRQQGFMFSKASWLERIHNNGGRPIYGDGNARRQITPRRRIPSPPAPPALVMTPSFPQPAPLRPVPETQALPPLRQPPTPTSPPVSAASTADLDAILVKAKAFRPLATYLLAEIAKAVPGSTAMPDGAHVLVSAAGQPFAVLAVSARELRLGLALSGKPFDAIVQAAKLPGAPAAIAPHLSHMAVLTDARQINDALMARIRTAATHSFDRA